jgi:hypothetical protein
MKLDGFFPAILKPPAIIKASAAPMCRARESASAYPIQRFLDSGVVELVVLVDVVCDEVMKVNLLRDER